MSKFIKNLCQVKLLKYLTISSAILIIGCSNPNGTYIIFSSEPYGYYSLNTSARDGYDDQVSELLTQKMLGRRFTMEYNEDFIIVKDGGPEVILQRRIENRDTVYRSVRQEDGKKIQYDLYMNPKRKSNTLIATAEWTANEVDTTGQTLYNVNKIARVKCQIKKYEKN